MSYLKFFDNTAGLEERLKDAKVRLSWDPNCYSTAFFLARVLPYDVVVRTGKSNERVMDAISQMRELSETEDGCIIFSFDALNVRHASFVAQTNPLEGFHRLGAWGSLTEFQSMSAIDKYLDEIARESIPKVIRPYTHRFFTATPKEMESWAREIVTEYSPGWEA